VKRRLIGVDVGGTFTDVMAIEDGHVIAAKVPTNVVASETSVLQGAAEVEAGRASVFNLASTAGLNAVITRKLPKIAFLGTLGHRDSLDRGRLWRPFEALTDVSWTRGFGDASRRPLVPRYLRRGISERLMSDGQVFSPLDRDQARAELSVLANCADLKGIAVCLLHSYRNPVHELELRDLIYEVLGSEIAVSLSSDVCPLAGEYARASTTTIDLLMKLKYTEYTARLEAGLSDLGFEGEFNYADCSAMLLPSSYAMERPYRLIVGGPAAGTMASAHFGEFIGDKNLLCADIGGTSADISVVLDGKPWANSSFELEWDMVVSALSTEIVTLGAGGGSVVAIGGTGQLTVGPESAGADPGPACYGKGGVHPTITDVALTMGILAPDRFLGGKVPLRPDLALHAFESLDTSLPISECVRQAWLIGLQHVAEGLVDITIRRGVDPRDFSLVAFGAAGPMMLPSLLDMLPLKKVIVPPNPGGFSALGLLSSDRVYSETRTLYGILDGGLAPKVERLFSALEDELKTRAGVASEEATILRSFDGRLLGQGFETPFIPVENGPIGPDQISRMVDSFHNEYEKRNRNRFDSHPVEGVTYRVQVVVPSEKVEYLPIESGSGVPKVAGHTVIAHLYSEPREVDCYERPSLLAGQVIVGPAVIWEEMSTTFVPDGYKATVGTYGELHVD